MLENFMLVQVWDSLCLRVKFESRDIEKEISFVFVEGRAS